jgi:hypothetical protein
MRYTGWHDGARSASRPRRLDLFGGRLEIDSAPEEGTRATVFAPLQFYRTHYRTQDTPPEPGEQTGGEDGDGE